MVLFSNTYYTVVIGNPIKILDVIGRTILQNVGFSAVYKIAQNKTKRFNWTESDIDFDYERSICTISGSTPLSNVKLRFAFKKDSPKISVWSVIEYKYKPKYCYECGFGYKIRVSSEFLTFNFSKKLKVSEIYKKNRKVHKKRFKKKYWLEKQGIKLGAGERSVFMYHAPSISSLSFKPRKRQLIVYLDDERDHNFNWVSDVGNGRKYYVNRSCSEYANGEHHSNEFVFYAGFAPNITPRMMISPQGYLSTFIWTEHSDNNTLESTLAVYFGSSCVKDLDKPEGGFAKHKIPVTKAVFYTTSNDGNISLFDHQNSAKYRQIIQKLYEKYGLEITLHTASSHPICSEKTEEAIDYFRNTFKNTNWVDHSGSVNRECISAEGLNPQHENYIRDSLEKGNVKYIWNYGSELKYNAKCTFLNDSHGLDLLWTSGIRGEKKHTPFWWKHPTVMKSFITWKSVIIGRLRHYPVTGLQWYSMISEGLRSLIKDWGISIIHDYMCWAYQKKMALSNGIYYRANTDKDTPFYIVPEFDAMLALLANYRAMKMVNITTVDRLLEYTVLLENIDYKYVSIQILIITNHNEMEIKDLSLVLSGYSVLVNGKNPDNYKIIGNDIVVWFDIGSKEQVKLSTKPMEKRLNPPVIIINKGIITILSENFADKIYYTLDGTEPNMYTIEYKEPVSFKLPKSKYDERRVIYAKSFKLHCQPSIATKYKL